MGDDNVNIEDLWRQHRPYLVDLGFRMLGSIHDAEDVVQEAFARLVRADLAQIEEVRGWLVVVVSRLCLDQLRSAHARHQATVATLDEQADGLATAVGADPADRVTLDDSLRMALLVVLQQLSPAERTVFVLHDIFRYSFDSVAEIVGRTPAACRQLASRARRRVESETRPARFVAGVNEQHHIAEEFIAACAGGDLDGLLRLLDPDVVGEVDLGLLAPPRPPLHGSPVVARGLLGFYGPRSSTTLVSQPLAGHPGALAFHSQALVGMLVFKVRDGRIYDIHAIADPQKLEFVSSQLSSPA